MEKNHNSQVISKDIDRLLQRNLSRLYSPIYCFIAVLVHSFLSVKNQPATVFSWKHYQLARSDIASPLPQLAVLSEFSVDLHSYHGSGRD